jgi:uridine kinase
MREKIYIQIAKNIDFIDVKHLKRVAIDGITASGKSTFAQGLVEHLRAIGKSVIYTTLDGFHNPKEKRYRLGRKSPEGYYRDAYNYYMIKEKLLKPLGPNGNLEYYTKVFDLENDCLAKTSSNIANQDDILIVDGSFSLRPELIDHWELKIYLEVDFDEAQRRSGIRDKELFGSSEAAIETTKSRYHEAHKIHNAESRPKDKANYVIDNNLPEKPKLLKKYFAL